MATHTIEYKLKGPFEAAEPLLEAWTFYEANHYSPKDPLQLAMEPMEHMTMERGRPKSGWYVSDMSQLYTTIEMVLEDDVICLTYEVDVSGQVLNDDDRAFWPKEISALEAYLCDGAKVKDVSEDESKRASQQREKSVATGMKWGIGLSILIFIIAFVLKTLMMGPPR